MHVYKSETWLKRNTVPGWVIFDILPNGKINPIFVSFFSAFLYTVLELTVQYCKEYELFPHTMGIQRELYWITGFDTVICWNLQMKLSVFALIREQHSYNPCCSFTFHFNEEGRYSEMGHWLLTGFCCFSVRVRGSNDLIGWTDGAEDPLNWVDYFH